MSILEQFRLDGKIAIVTGAGKGIGAAISKAFAEAGADVVLASRSLEPMQKTAEAVEACGRKALIVQTDVMDNDQLKALVDKTIEAFGKIDILVNNAGGYPPKPALDTQPKDMESAFKFNVVSAFELTRLCAPHMVEAGGGSVINISSVAGQYPSSWFAAYGVAKGALTFLTQELAQEFAPKIRVNAIGVGSTKTDALNTVLNDEIEQAMVALTPMARLGEVEDIAAGAVYLASPAASYVTGDVLGINGGLTRLNMEMPRAFG